jgi:SNF2 family DNA or RNA helicase
VAFTGNETDNLATKASSDWITNEIMKQVCPDVELAPYQLIGVNWLALLYKMTVKVNGKLTPVNGVLADEMGLGELNDLVSLVLISGATDSVFLNHAFMLDCHTGKTCQTIAFLALLKCGRLTDGSTAPRKTSVDDDLVDSDDDSIVSAEDNPVDLPHLIVVPASVLSNWVNEFKKFAPQLNVVKFHGSMAERDEIKLYLEQFRSGKKRRYGESLDVILAPTTYFQKEKSDDRSFLRKFRYNYMMCVVDIFLGTALPFLRSFFFLTFPLCLPQN